MPHSKEDEDAWTLVMSETSDPDVRLRLLSFRVSVVTREKEELNERVKVLEAAYTAGKSIFWLAPIIGAMASFFWYNWSWVTKPWSKQ